MHSENYIQDRLQTTSENDIDECQSSSLQELYQSETDIKDKTDDLKQIDMELTP